MNKAWIIEAGVAARPVPWPQTLQNALSIEYGNKQVEKWGCWCTFSIYPQQYN